jgi:hypothetical protein
MNAAMMYGVVSGMDAYLFFAAMAFLSAMVSGRVWQ